MLNVTRRKEVMRIGDENLFEIGSRVESPSVENQNTVSTKARIHHTVRIGSHCSIGPKCFINTSEDIKLDDYTVLYGPNWEERLWSGRGQKQAEDLSSKHVEYLKEWLPKFNRLRRGEVP